MITDKILWPKHYNPATADVNAEADVTADGLRAEDIWPYLVNMADIAAMVHEVVDANPADSSVNDPHMFAKEEFTLDTTLYSARLRVVDATAPKGDRAGRITWEGEGTMRDSGRTFHIVHAWVLDVEKGDSLNVLSAISVTGDGPGTDYFADLNDKWLSALVRYARERK